MSPVCPAPSARLAEALVRWQHAAGPFWPYVCAAPFLATDEALALARRARQRRLPSPGRRWSQGALPLADRLVGDGPHPQGGALAAVLADLPPEPILALASLLVERGWYVVPVVQRWIASPAVLPCRWLIEALLAGAWRACRPRAPRGVVLVADGARAGPPGYPLLARGRVFDNRYEYQICRFPSTAFLQAHGIRQVRWLTSGTSPVERPVRRDLVPYLEELLRAGLEVDVAPWPERA